MDSVEDIIAKMVAFDVLSDPHDAAIERPIVAVAQFEAWLSLQTLQTAPTSV